MGSHLFTLDIGYNILRAISKYNTHRTSGSLMTCFAFLNADIYRSEIQMIFFKLL